MTNIQLSEGQLNSIGSAGGQRAAKALSVLAKRKVNVQTKGAKAVAPASALQEFERIVTTETAVVAYTQVISGISGVSLLSIERKDALLLVDLFNNRAAGVTKVMQEIDRSTIKETLNILANSYVTELARVAQTTIRLDVPSIVTKARAAELIKEVKMGEDRRIIAFQAELAVEEANFQVSLYFLFLTEVASAEERKDGQGVRG